MKVGSRLRPLIGSFSWQRHGRTEISLSNARAAGSGLSSRKIEKETKRTKYYSICIDNHFLSYYTNLNKAKEVHYGTQ